MPSYGQIRRELSQVCSGASLDQLDAWLRDRYAEILDTLDWTRLQKSVALTLPDQVNAGTVALVNGSTGITGTGTAWAEALGGRLFRVVGQNEYYQFTYTSPTSGALDRPYAGPTATTLAYRINAVTVTLPADCRSIEPPQLLDPPREIEIRSLGDIAEQDPSLANYGPPAWVAWQFDSASNPPAPQLRVWPIPVKACTIALTYTADADLGNGSSQSLLPWMRPACIKAGVQADHARWAKEFMAAEIYERRFAELRNEMVRAEAGRTPPEQIGMNPYYTRHRRARYSR